MERVRVELMIFDRGIGAAVVAYNIILDKF
jgi:hypothetical protein